MKYQQKSSYPPSVYFTMYVCMYVYLFLVTTFSRFSSIFKSSLCFLSTFFYSLAQIQFYFPDTIDPHMSKITRWNLERISLSKLHMHTVPRVCPTKYTENLCGLRKKVFDQNIIWRILNRFSLNFFMIIHTYIYTAIQNVETDILKLSIDI